MPIESEADVLLFIKGGNNVNEWERLEHVNNVFFGNGLWYEEVLRDSE